MNYTQLTGKKKVEIDILLKQGMSMRQVGKVLNISHSTISRYKANIYQKRKENIKSQYERFLKYLYENYDYRNRSIEVCVEFYKRKYPYSPCPSFQQVYNWIKLDKINIRKNQLCYKKRRSKRNGMMRHLEWNLENKTVLPIRLRPKYIEDRNEIGHLEIDSIIGKKNEYDSIISIVDRTTRKLWLIKADFKNEYYISNLIYNFIIKNKIVVNSITTDNGLEFSTLGIAAKKLGVKLYKCDPYCSFQRGTNERMNAIVRRYIPKGSSLRMKPQIYLDDIAFKINSMPRKMFDFKTPVQVELNY